MKEKKRSAFLLRLIYPVWALIGVFSLIYVPAVVVEEVNLVETANNLQANELLFRAGVVGSLITQLLHVVVVVLLYKLFKNVDNNLTRLLFIFGLLGVPISMLNSLNRMAALQILINPIYLKFPIDQLHALVKLFLDLNQQGIVIAGIFWGLWLFPLGLLSIRSKYFPKYIGYILIIAGFGYIIDSFSRLLIPTSYDYPPTLTILTTLMTLGELVFMGWFVVKGAEIKGK